MSKAIMLTTSSQYIRTHNAIRAREALTPSSFPDYKLNHSALWKLQIGTLLIWFFLHVVILVYPLVYWHTLPAPERDNN